MRRILTIAFSLVSAMALFAQSAFAAVVNMR